MNNDATERGKPRWQMVVRGQGEARKRSRKRALSVDMEHAPQGELAGECKQRQKDLDQ